jgi:hypothetical protein
MTAEGKPGNRICRARLAASLYAMLAAGCSFDQAGIGGVPPGTGGQRRAGAEPGVDGGGNTTSPPPDGSASGEPTPGASPMDASMAVDRAAAGPVEPAAPDAPADRPLLVDPSPIQDAGPDRPPILVVPGTPGSRILLRINVNGPELDGVSFPGFWNADPGVDGVCGPNAFRTDVPINGTDDDQLFQGEMFGNPLICSVGGGVLPSGPYQVNLYFAEIHWGPGCPGGGLGIGARLFDIRIEGDRIAEDVDLFLEGGCAASFLGLGRPVVKQFRTTITDGTLDLQFDVTADNAKISAIELISAW